MPFSDKDNDHETPVNKQLKGLFDEVASNISIESPSTERKDFPSDHKKSLYYDRLHKQSYSSKTQANKSSIKITKMLFSPIDERIKGKRLKEILKSEEYWKE